MKRVFITAGKIVVTASLFILLFWPETFGLPSDTFGGVKPYDLWNEITSMNPAHALPWILFALLIRLSGIMCGVIRWKILLYGQNIHIPFLYMVQSWFIGRTIGIFLPSTIGLDGYRLYDSIRYTGEALKCTTVIFIEKIIGFISLTTLVFLTFPLGFRLLKFNILILSAVIIILGLAVLFFLSLLLQPYIIQIILYSIPVPNKIRNILIKLGNSATAYSGQKGYLLLAILCGLAVHLSACLMYFGTMMALRSENTSLWDVLFASPLMIYGTVLGPSIGGEGIREVVFTLLLGGKENPQKVIAFAHLGWWVGDVVPFLIGLPFLTFRKRPTKEEVQTQMGKVAPKTSSCEPQPISQQEISSIRNAVAKNFSIAFIGAIIAGELCGLAEAVWTQRVFTGIQDLQSLWWGPLLYGIGSAGLGTIFAFFVCVWIPLLLRKFPSGSFSFVCSFTFTLLSLGLMLVYWRYKRDILAEKPTSPWTYIPILFYYLGGVLISSSIFYVITFFITKKVNRKVVLLLLFLLAISPYIGGGIFASAFNKTPQDRQDLLPPNFTPAIGKPNIILIVADALRADFLSIYNPNIGTKTPNLVEFAKDSITFTDCSSQGSWTKPSFGSIYTGTLPHIHEATTKNSLLNADLPTVAEILTKSGYFTKGYGNNPNVHPSFGFSKGFTQYTYLTPKRLFFADESSSKLTIYEFQRRIHAIVSQTLHKITGIPPNIKYFYHPGEDLNSEVLSWLENYKSSAPFFLVVHYMDTHDPFFNRDNKKDFFARAIIGNKLKPELTPRLKDAYISEIEYFDKCFGNLISELKRKGIYQNSYIIFTSDHGEEFGDHGGWWHGFTLYQEMLHVPLIVKVPDRIKTPDNSNVRVNQMVRSIDISSTILEWAEAEIPPSFQGLPLISKEGMIIYENTDKINHSFAENNLEGLMLKSIRKGNFKLILANPDNPRGLAEQELYDLSKDPLEKNNLASHPQSSLIKENLHSLIRKVLVESQPVQKQSKPNTREVSTELQEQLKSLGYMD
ncbi:MAG: sulfatase-like hydrolase/transferase [Candidatus Hydrogenedentes bacterium]|nr:sulfatase-like hydrolase/transferase [Candidatus Hydrogenedentota bacterium]